MPKLSTTPASIPAEVAAVGSSIGTRGDTYGSITATAGTELMRVGPPLAGHFTRCYLIRY